MTIRLEGEDERLFNELTATLAPRIQVVSLLGRGGMGSVYLGRDPLLKRSIAIKMLSPQFAGSETARARFTREAQAAATMTHPNVAAVYDVGELPSGTPYFLMQFIDGVSLDDVVRAEGMFAEPRARRLMGEIASALAAAHARGLVHRDVKPANVIVDNETKRAIVVDFGITSALDKERFEGSGTLTQVGTYVGTPRYTSPEQAAGEKVSGKSDVYSLGILAYEVLSGRVPFQESNPMALLAAHMMSVPPAIRTLRPDLDAGFAALVDRCLLKDPAARPEAAEIASFLVPEPQAAIEWPPPGLEELRGLGARAATAVNWVGALITLFVLTLAVQPTRGTAAWQQMETSLVWSLFVNATSGSSTATTADATPQWVFLLTMYVFAAFVALVVLVARSVTLASALRRGLRLGYPRKVVLSVAADDADDTSDLLNRSSSYAMLTPTQQRTLIRARAARMLALPLGFLFTMVLSAVWVFGPAGDGYSVELLPAGTALLLALPALGGVVVFLYFFVVELRLRGHEGWSRTSRFVVRPEFVRDWLQRFSGDHLRVTPVAFVVPVVTIALTLVMLIGMLAVATSINISSSLVRPLQRAYVSTTDITARYMTSSGALVEALKEIARPVRVVHRDSGAVRALAIGAFLPALQPWSSTTDTAEFFRRQEVIASKRVVAGLGGDTTRVPSTLDENWGFYNQFIRAKTPREQMSPDVVRRIASPWLQPLRRFARSDSGAAPFFYFTQDLLRQYVDDGLRTAWWRVSMPGLNGAIAQFMVSLRTGRLREARAIGEELARAATRFLLSPSFEENRAGQTLARASIQLFQEYLAVAPDTALTRQVIVAGDWLERVEDRRTDNEYNQQLWGMAGNLSLQSDVLTAIGDRRLLPNERWYMMSALVDAYCTNAREILFGVSPRRRVFLDSAARLAADIPRTNEWRDIQRARLDRWIGDPRTELARSRRDYERGWRIADLFGGFGLKGMQARMRYCDSLR